MGKPEYDIQKDTEATSHLIPGLAEIRSLYQEYLDGAERAEREHRPGDGLFGLGKKPSDDPCHERFSNALETALRDFAARGPDSPQIREVLSHIYRAPVEHRKPMSAYWMLNAVHGFTLDLIGRLNADDAAALFASYAKSFSRRERLPVQQQVYAALKRAAK